MTTDTDGDTTPTYVSKGEAFDRDMNYIPDRDHRGARPLPGPVRRRASST